MASECRSASAPRCSVARSIVAPRVSAIAAPRPAQRPGVVLPRLLHGNDWAARARSVWPTALLGDLGGKAHSEAKLGAIESPVELGERA